MMRRQSRQANFGFALKCFEEDSDTMMNECIAKKGFFDYDFNITNLKEDNDDDADNIIDYELDEIATVIGERGWANVFDLPIEHLTKIKKLLIANVKSIPLNVNKLTSLVHIVIISSPEVSIPYPLSCGIWKTVRVLAIGLENHPYFDWIQHFENLEALFVYSHPYFSKKRCYTPMPINAWIGNLKNLKALSISSPHFSSLAQGLGKLKQLKSLNLSSVSIHQTSFRRVPLKPKVGSIGIEKLPHSIGELPKLEVLDLSYTTRLEALPNNFDKLVSLEILNLEGSGIVLRRVYDEEDARLELRLRENDRELILRLPALLECQGVHYDSKMTLSFLSNIAMSKFFRPKENGSTELVGPPLSWWPLILAKGAAALGPRSHRGVQALKKLSDEVRRQKSIKTAQAKREPWEEDSLDDEVSEILSILAPVEGMSRAAPASVAQGVAPLKDLAATFLLLREYSEIILPSKP